VEAAIRAVLQGERCIAPGRPVRGADRLHGAKTVIYDSVRALGCIPGREISVRRK